MASAWNLRPRHKRSETHRERSVTDESVSPALKTSGKSAPSKSSKVGGAKRARSTEQSAAPGDGKHGRQSAKRGAKEDGGDRNVRKKRKKTGPESSIDGMHAENGPVNRALDAGCEDGEAITPQATASQATEITAQEAPQGETKKNHREWTLKEIISKIGKVGDAIPMPSAVRREEESRRRRSALMKRRAREKKGDIVEEKKVKEDEEENRDYEGNTNTQSENANAFEKDVNKPDEALESRADDSESGSEGDMSGSDEENFGLGPGIIAAPKVMLDENGRVVIDQSSLVVSTGSVVNPDAEKTAVTRVENGSVTNHVTSASYRKKEKSTRWTEKETEKFYSALRQFGTDFSMIEKLFEGRSRRVIKLKFKREERLFPERIDKALRGPRKPIDLMEYRKQAGLENIKKDEQKLVKKEENEYKKERSDNETCASQAGQNGK